MARSLAQTKHLDTTDCSTWRLCPGNLATRPLASHGCDGWSGLPYDAIAQQGARRALGLRQAWPGKKETHAPPDATLHHVRHPLRTSRFLCM